MVKPYDHKTLFARLNNACAHLGVRVVERVGSLRVAVGGGLEIHLQ